MNSNKILYNKPWIIIDSHGGWLHVHEIIGVSIFKTGIPRLWIISDRGVYMGGGG